MPAKKKRERVARGDPEVEAERRRLFVRSVLFGGLVLVLMTVALSFVVSTFKSAPGDDRVPITASVSYTVKLMEVPSARAETAQAMLRLSDMRSMAGRHELFLRSLPGDRIALCAGRFDSADSPEARSLLSSFRDYTIDGEPCFTSAQMWSYEPDGLE